MVEVAGGAAVHDMTVPWKNGKKKKKACTREKEGGKHESETRVKVHAMIRVLNQIARTEWKLPPTKIMSGRADFIAGREIRKTRRSL